MPVTHYISHMAYNLIKMSLDPVVLLLILIAIGFLFSFKQNKIRSCRLLLLIAFLFLYLTSSSPIPNALCYVLEKDYLLNQSDNVGALDVVVVLAGGASDNEYLGKTVLSYQTTSRLFYAVQLFRESGAKFLVCSGKGLGKVSEAEVMGIAAERLGVPLNAIKIEPRARNTWEHPKEVKKMFFDRAIRIGLVTSAYHMKRSEREFRKYFSDVVPFPSEYLYSSPLFSIHTLFPDSDNLYKFSTAFREIVGIAWYKTRG